MMIHSIGDISSCGCHFMASQREGTVGKESFTNTNVLLQVQYVIFALVHHPQNTDGLRISAVLRLCISILACIWYNIFLGSREKSYPFNMVLKFLGALKRIFCFTLSIVSNRQKRNSAKRDAQKRRTLDVQKYVFSANVDFVYFANRFCVKVCRIV